MGKNGYCDDIKVRVHRNGDEEPLLFVDFGPRVRFTSTLEAARDLIAALDKAIWEALYPRSS